MIELFSGAKDAKDLIMRLSLVTDKPLEKGQTIFFLDEVQEFKDIIARIKFLVEDGTYRYIMSGSLLGVELNDLRSAPVGYLKTNDLVRVAEVHDKIIRLYRTDFTKYESKYKLKLQEIYDSMPGQLDQKNKRFKLNCIGKGVSYDRVANDFLWIKDAGVVIPVYNISEPKLPLVISENRNLFKLFCSDVGLLTSRYSNYVKMAILNIIAFLENQQLTNSIYKLDLRGLQ